MDFSSISDTQLDINTLQCAKNERVCLHLLLEHMAEVQKRKSFSPRYRDIKHYTEDHLKYGEKSARERVSAMFLMMEIPEVTPSIRSGDLDLSKIATVQRFVRAENGTPDNLSEPSLFGDEEPRHKITTEDKRKIVEEVLHKSVRQTERHLADQSSNPEKFKVPDQIMPLKKNLNKIQTTLTDEDLEVLKELRGLLAHKIPDGSLSEILSVALKTTRDAIKKQKSVRADETPIPTEKRTPTASMKRAVYARAKGKCELCGSQHRTETDHVITWAHRGKTTLENLRLLCRNCNQREAYKKFGPRPMQT